jgi:hypothetical protein
LGVTCHWIQDEKLVENVLAFYLWPFDHSKTRDIIADVLKKKMLKDHEILDNIKRVGCVTDQGSNLIKCFFKILWIAGDATLYI